MRLGRNCLTAVCLLTLSLSASGEVNDSTSLHTLHEVVVTGSNNAVSSNLLPYTVSVIKAEELAASPTNQLLSAISGMVPSLFVTRRNIYGFGVSTGGAGHIKLRGVGGDRASGVLMLLDGQPQFAGLYSHHVADMYLTDNVERIEVLRGPASVLYGSNAMAGVINVITSSPKEDGTRTTLSSQYGSFNTWLTTLSNTNRYGRFSSVISAGYNRTDGVRKNFDFSQTNAYAKIGYDFSRQWTLNADYTILAFSASDPVYPSLKGDEGVYRHRVIRGETSVSVTNRYLATNGAVRLYYSYGNHFIHDPSYFHSLDDRMGLLTYQNVTPWKDANLTIGFDFDRYSGKIPVSGGKDYLAAPLATLHRKFITEYSPYLTFAQNLLNSKLSLNIGLRLALSSMFDSQWVPQGGITYHPAIDWTVKGSVAKGYRNPSFRELYLYKFANPDLQPEEMINYEISVGKGFGKILNVDITAYWSKGSNLIRQGSVLNENTGGFINKGIEVSATSVPTDKVRLWATYSYLDSSLKNLTGAPHQQYYIGGSWNVFKGFHADLQLKGVAELYVADDIRMQNYATLDLKLSYQIIKQLKIFVNLDNITDARYIINKGYPMAGFAALGGFRLDI